MFVSFQLELVARPMAAIQRQFPRQVHGPLAQAVGNFTLSGSPDFS